MRTQIAILLTYISSEEREIWIRIGMALKALLGDYGFDLFDQWSQTSKSYRTKHTVTAWKSFNSNSIGLGTLIHHAQKNGFQNTNIHRKLDIKRPQNKRKKEQKKQLDAAKEAERRWRAAKNIGFQPLHIRQTN